MTIRLILLATLVLAGCNQKSPTAPPRSGSAEYNVRGVLLTVKPARNSAIIAHEEIPGYMEAMTMEFDVASPAEFAGLESGDILTFRLSVTETDSKISNVKKVGRAAAKPYAEFGVPAEGNPLPDVALVDDAGRSFRLSDRKGRILALTFIFIRCPLPDYCPRMSSHFAAAMRDLGAVDCEFLSVTIDPANDTPERLAEYARAFRNDPGRWTFATGDAAEIKKLATFAGLEVKGDGPGITHNLRTIVVDSGGKVTRVLTGNEWKPSDLVAEIQRVSRIQR